jgi:hypothetical protein
MIPDGVVLVIGPKVVVVLIRIVDAGTFVAGSAITGAATASNVSKPSTRGINVTFFFIFSPPQRSFMK